MMERWAGLNADKKNGGPAFQNGGQACRTLIKKIERWTGLPVTGSYKKGGPVCRIQFERLLLEFQLLHQHTSLYSALNNK
jgi:hypothetical protein